MCEKVNGGAEMRAEARLEKIASFTVDHTKLRPGLYVSRRDGETSTYDLRFKTPNTGDLLSNAQLHSVEHLIATLLRSGAQKENIVYFGPMGCQTGFYLITRNMSDENVRALVRDTFAQAALYAGEMPGYSAKECGNYRNLSVEEAKRVCAWYAELMRAYPCARMQYES